MSLCFDTYGGWGEDLVTDQFELERFVAAQSENGTYARAIEELRRGRKSSHWMWFVFPQVVDLGQSAMSKRYGIRSLEEARAYLAHPILGPRLFESTETLASLTGRSAQDVLGDLDAVKLQSSMTLFAEAAPHETRFQQVLAKYFDSSKDQTTLELISKGVARAVPLGRGRSASGGDLGSGDTNPPGAARGD